MLIYFKDVFGKQNLKKNPHSKGERMGEGGLYILSYKVL